SGNALASPVAADDVYTIDMNSVLDAAYVGDTLDGLSHYWNFDETDGDLAHDSIGGNDIELFNWQLGDNQWVEGRVGGALELVSSGQKGITTSPLSNASDQYTIAFWSNLTTKTSLIPMIFGPVGRNWIVYQADRQRMPDGIGFYHDNSTNEAFARTGPVLGAWEHYTVVFDRATQVASIYRDGNLEATDFVDRPVPTTEWILGHHHDPGNNGYTWIGKFDDLRVYDRLLNPFEIQQVAAREDTRVDNRVLANDADADGDVLSAVLVDDVSHGTLTFESDGTFQYTPDADFFGTDSFTYRASDGDSTSELATVSIVVRPSEFEPVAEDDHFRMREDQTLTIGIEADASTQVLTLSVHDLVYDAAERLLYASIPASVPDLGGSIAAIDPDTGQIVDTFAVVGEPTRMVIADDSSFLYAVTDNDRAVQPIDLTTGSLGEKFFMPGAGEFAEHIKTIESVPGSPDSLLISRYLPGWSPPATGTAIYKNGVALPGVSGTGVGVGGPDITTINDTGDRAYGFQNSLTSAGFWNLLVSDQGLRNNPDRPAGTPFEAFDVSQIAAAGNWLFSDLGQVVDVRTNLEVDTFPGGDNFVLDPDAHRLFSVTTAGGVHTIHEYDYENQTLLDSQQVAGVNGSTFALTRFGGNGLAFATSNGRVVILRSDALLDAIAPGVLANDSDPNDRSLQTELLSPPDHGTLTLNDDGTFNYTPDDDYFGADEFTYQVTNRLFDSQPATVRIDVRAVNDAPRPVADAYETPWNTTLSVSPAIGVLSNDTDVDSLALEAELFEDATHGEVILLATGSFLYLPDENFGGEDSFLYRVWDGQNYSEPTLVRIQVVAPFTPIDPHVTTNGIDVGFTIHANGEHLDLYSGADVSGNLGDVRLVGAQHGPIAGSLLLDEQANRLYFISHDGALPADTYQFTIFSRDDSLLGPNDAEIDGNGDGTPGDDYVFDFEVAAPTDPQIWLEDFARGPGQAVDIRGTGGIPVWLNQLNGVTSVELVVRYNPALLTITNAVPAGPVADSWLLDEFATVAPGRVSLRMTGPAVDLSSSAHLFALVAEVPDTATAGSEHRVIIETTNFNDASVVADGTSAVHRVAYLGDASNDGTYSAFDASLIARLAVGLDAGLAAFGSLHPKILADVSGDGTVSALDASYVARAAVGLPQDEIPPITGAESFSSTLELTSLESYAPPIIAAWDISADRSTVGSAPPAASTQNGSSVPFEPADSIATEPVMHLPAAQPYEWLREAAESSATESDELELIVESIAVDVAQQFGTQE
ncbi:MAG: tandem-95 repeat protein, partial [Planctomycetales bacterium]|nr:tandem-95 repeat protein [Planctomycetales bacterium]